MLEVSPRGDLGQVRLMITGGAGFIGSHLVDQVLAQGAAYVLVVDNFFLGSMDNLRTAAMSNRVEVVRLDAADTSAMFDLATSRGIDVLFNMAVVPLPTSLDYPSWTVTTNVELATTACELARKGAVDLLVHCSSSEVYGSARTVPMTEDHPLNPLTPYAASKSGADQIVDAYVRTYGIRATTVRPFNNFGPRQNAGQYAGIIPKVVKGVLSQEPIDVHGDGEQTRDLTFVRDTVKQIVRVAGSEACVGEVVHIASGVEVSVNSLVRQILEILEQPDYPIVHSAERQADVRRHRADTSKIEGLLGARSSSIFSESLAETVAWYRDRM